MYACKFVNAHSTTRDIIQLTSGIAVDTI